MEEVGTPIFLDLFNDVENFLSGKRVSLVEGGYVAVKNTSVAS